MKNSAAAFSLSTCASLAGLAVICCGLAACGARDHSIATEKIIALQAAAPPADNEWRSYLGDKASNQYSPLTQLTRDNVSQLQQVWRYDHGDQDGYATQIPTNPLIVKGVLYGFSAKKNLFALDAATGEELWVYPFNTTDAGKGAGRGLVYWQDGVREGGGSQRILAGVANRLYAIDAVSGELINDFADGGSIDLREGLDRPVEGLSVSANSPGTVYRNLLILGFGTSETYGAAPGYIRAYHIPTGELRWTFRTIPAAGEFGSDTWPQEHRDEFGGANAWAGITVDEQRGIAFVPTGSAADDFYGSNRAGDNLFANSLLALDANTGERIWHYQVVRHDLWDRDLPSPPNLITVHRDGKDIPAVSQATKSGHLFVFHRETGEPLFPIEEVPTVGQGVPGEHPAVSQPRPLLPPAFAKQTFEMTDLGPAERQEMEDLLGPMVRNEYAPNPGEAGIVLFPGSDGGAEWGGQSWDAGGGMLYVNSQEVAAFYRMNPVTVQPELYSLSSLYKYFCAGCHGLDRRGNGDSFPSLRDIGDRYWPWETYRIISKGRGRMPSFGNNPWWYNAAAVYYLHYGADAEEEEALAQGGDIIGYTFDGYNVPRLPNGLPGSKPPWGSLAAIDINRAEIAWKIPLGDYPQAREMGLSGLGAENYGGPVATAGGLVFIAATPDNKIRAFDKTNGKLLWQGELPAAGFATPAVYEANGRQFIVIAAGGGRLGQPSGSSYVAFALPQ